MNGTRRFTVTLVVEVIATDKDDCAQHVAELMEYIGLNPEVSVVEKPE